MKVFFTADCHFGHSNIIEYSNRPFKDSEEMEFELVKRWNKVVARDDIVYHLGDFSYNKRAKTRELEKHLHGRIVHIAGNHDPNNGLKSLIYCADLRFGGKKVWAQHVPPMPGEFPLDTDLILCGHVHDKWKFGRVEDTPMINVGVDVWGYQPVSMVSILKACEQMEKSEG